MAHGIAGGLRKQETSRIGPIGNDGIQGYVSDTEAGNRFGTTGRRRTRIVHSEHEPGDEREDDGCTDDGEAVPLPHV